jgi:hypothetical protein
VLRVLVLDLKRWLGRKRGLGGGFWEGWKGRVALLTSVLGFDDVVVVLIWGCAVF